MKMVERVNRKILEKTDVLGSLKGMIDGIGELAESVEKKMDFLETKIASVEKKMDKLEKLYSSSNKNLNNADSKNKK